MVDGLGHDTVGAVALDAQAGSVVYAIKQGQAKVNKSKRLWTVEY